MQLILGTVYGYSIFWKPLQANVFPPVITEAERADRVAAGEPVADTIVVADEDTRQKQIAIQQGYLKYAFSICILTFAITMVIAGRIQDVKGPRFPAIIGAILMGAGFITAGLMKTPIVFYIAHATFAGVVAIVLLMLFHAFFGHLDPQQRIIVRYVPMGIVTSVIVAGAGIGFAYVCPIAALVKWFPK